MVVLKEITVLTTQYNQWIRITDEIERVMKESGIGYGSINHPVDRDPACGYNGIIGDTCPNCGRSHDFDYPKCPFCGHSY